MNTLIDLMNELDTNFRIVLPSDGKYGGRSNRNFRWNGMIGLVLDNVSFSANSLKFHHIFSIKVKQKTFFNYIILIFSLGG